MLGSNSHHPSGWGIAMLGAALALALGWPLSSSLGHTCTLHCLLYIRLIVARIGCGPWAFCVLVLGSCERLVPLSPLSCHDDDCSGLGGMDSVAVLRRRG